MAGTKTLSVIILTGGEGRRFQQADGTLKQFAHVAGEPLFIHCLKLYESISVVDEIILVINRDYRAQYQAILAQYAFKKVAALVDGGKFRHVSIANGLAKIAHDGLVLIQNGVNPTTPVSTITSCIARAQVCDAVSAYVSASHTIFECNEDEVANVLNRRKLGYTCDPQVFSVPLAREALQLTNADASGDVPMIELVKRLGRAVKLVASTNDNLKVTRPLDLIVIEHILLAKNES